MENFKSTKDQLKNFEQFQRNDFRERNNFNDTQYYKIASLAVKFYTQAVALGRDIEGNQLTEEELNTSKMILSISEKEIEANRKKFYDAQRENDNEEQSE